MLMAPTQEPRRLKLQPHQMEAWKAREPFVAFVTGLGGGKTWLGARWILTRAARFPRSLHLATGNSYPQCRDTVVPALLRACEEFGWSYVWKRADMVLLLPWGAEIRVRSTENYELLRGPEYGSWWADELRDCPRAGYDVILGRLRCGRVDRPRYLATTTPNGFDFIYERHVERQNPRYRLVSAPSTSNRFLSRDYIDDLRGAYDDSQIQQEIEGKFIAQGVGQVYRSFDRRVHAIDTAWDRNQPTILTCDFNVGRMAWLVCQERSGGQVHVVAEIGGVTVYDTARAYLDRGFDPAPIVYGDPSGNSRNHAGKTDYGMLREAIPGYQSRVQSAPPGVRDRANAVNAMLRNAKGAVRIYVDRSCKTLIRDLEQVVWNEHGTEIDKSNLDLTHASDALGYFIHAAHRPQVFRSEPGYGMIDPSKSRSLRSRYATVAS